MDDTVLASPQARQACTQMQSILNSGLAEALANLNTQGEILKSPDNWRGAKARQFRDDWQRMYEALRRAKESIEELRAGANQVTQNIMNAGNM